MARQRAKSNAPQVLKALMKSVRDIDTLADGTIKGDIVVKSAGNFREFRSFVQKFPEQAQKAHKVTLERLAEELEIALGIAMESKVWNDPAWPYGDGDIVQFGNLRDSLDIDVTESQISIAYREEYAAIVHFGGYIFLYGNPNVSVYMPARPWIKSVLLGGGPVEKFDFIGLYSKFFEEEMQRYLPK